MDNLLRKLLGKLNLFYRIVVALGGVSSEFRFREKGHNIILSSVNFQLLHAFSLKNGCRIF